MNICAMKDFDNEQQSRLNFLAKQGAHLHFPFFANTFSLAYHYSSCLLDYASRGWPETRTLISEHNWEYQYPNLLPDKPNLFYATSQAFDALEAKNKKIPTWDLVGYAFTRYRPRWVFVDSRASLQGQSHGRGGIPTFPDDLSTIIRNLNRPHLELLTDIPGQSAVITDRLRERGINNIEVLKDPKDALQRVDPTRRMLRLYFFGAPTTTKMHSDPERFIPFRIPDEVVGEDEPTSITQVCLAKPLALATVDAEERVKEKAIFRSQMREYHERIFEAASLARHHTELVNVWWAYNRYAERKQHTATFKTTEVFARCLQEHHGKI
jgi:hypothetical protein